jgi:hypothetical protein
LAKIIYLTILHLYATQIFALEKCNFQLNPKLFKVALNFYTDDERTEQKGSFTEFSMKGGTYGNSVRSIVENMEVFIPFNSINTYDTTRDRLVYNALIKNDLTKQKVIHIKVLKLEKNSAKLRIKLNNKTKDISFKYDSRDLSMQSIGYIDLEDFNLVEIKNIVEKKYNQKIWNDIFIDIRAKFNKNCRKEL